LPTSVLHAARQANGAGTTLLLSGASDVIAAAPHEVRFANSQGDADL
jgi:hypothetical protein